MRFTSIIYLQKRGLNFSGFTSAFMEFVAGKSGATVTDSAKFDTPKPDELDVSDDSWASLQLRVDPLARAILDPHNLYLGSILLTALLSAVFLAVKPGFQMYSGDDDFNKDDDFNDKYNNVDDFWKFRDVENNQYVYRNTAVARQRILWAVLFAVTVSAVIGITAVVAYMIESRNSRVDALSRKSVKKSGVGLNRRDLKFNIDLALSMKEWLDILCLKGLFSFVNSRTMRLEKLVSMILTKLLEVVLVRNQSERKNLLLALSM
jgi:hypothetical protein